MMDVVILYDVCMLFLLIIITLSPINKYKNIHENYVNRSHNYLLQIHMVRNKIKSGWFSWYIRL